MFRSARRSLAQAVLLSGATGLVVASTAAGQTARDIMLEAFDRYQAQAEGVAAYTLVQETMGMTTETRFERREVDGVQMFLPAGAQHADAEAASPLAAFPSLAEAATLEGVESLEEGSCHLLAIEDVSAMRAALGPMPEGVGHFEPRSATFCIDTRSYMMRRMEVAGDMTGEGEETHPATMRVASDDYREVEGLLVPFRTTVVFEGVEAVMGGEAQEMRAAMEAARAEMERMPPAQREAMEKMLEGQFAQLESMASGGAPTLTMTVTEVRVERE